MTALLSEKREETPPTPIYILALYPRGRWRVKRDMELLREVCRHIDERTDVQPRRVELPDREGWIVAHHVDMLWQVGFINGSRTVPLSTGVPDIMVKDFTWQGHEFAAALLNESVWAKVKAEAPPELLVRTPLNLLSSILGDLAAGVLKSHLGI